MNKPKLYLFIGYPGAGKTAVAKIIAENSNAHHIWADVERHKFFPDPTHSVEESQQLYQKLNDATEYLLSRGKSVIFDTNFNYKVDRDKLRTIGAKYKAETVLIWVKTPKNVSQDRAVNSRSKRNNYSYIMTPEGFHKIASKLEPPSSAEKAIEIDGTDLNKNKVINALKLHK